jgi:hypothetical protein
MSTELHKMAVQLLTQHHCDKAATREALILVLQNDQELLRELVDQYVDRVLRDVSAV